MRNSRTRHILKERERERNYNALEGTFRVSHTSPSTAECGESQSICPRTKVHRKQVATCPEPGPHNLATVIIEDKKEKHPLVQGRQYITVEYGYSLWYNLSSHYLFQNMFRERHSSESFCNPAIWHTQVGAAHLVPSLLEAEGSSNSNLHSKLGPQN